MLKSTARTVAEVLDRDSADGTDDPQTRKQPRQHIESMWNAWSGMAHRYAWPDLIPGERAADQHVVPGHWVGDFYQLASFRQFALTQLRDASLADPSKA